MESRKSVVQISDENRETQVPLHLIYDETAKMWKILKVSKGSSTDVNENRLDEYLIIKNENADTIEKPEKR